MKNVQCHHPHPFRTLHLVDRLYPHPFHGHHPRFPDDTFFQLSTTNKNSKNAIIVKSHEIVVEHVPEARGEMLFSLMKKWKLYKFKSTRRNLGP